MQLRQEKARITWTKKGKKSKGWESENKKNCKNKKGGQSKLKGPGGGHTFMEVEHLRRGRDKRRG